MKMAGPDIILFVVGFLLFAGAGYGLVATGDGLGGGGQTSVLGVFQVSYVPQTVEVGSANVGDLANAETTFTVDEIDVTKVLVTVTCTGPAASLPYTISVNVAGPNGLAGQKSGACGTAVEVPVTSLPADAAVQGRNEDEAHANLGEHPDMEKAKGEWTVTVTGSRSTAIGLPAPGPAGTISMSLEKWEHRFTPVQR